MSNTMRSAAIPLNGNDPALSDDSAIPNQSRHSLGGIPVSLLATCGDCGSKVRRADLREFGEKNLCPECFQAVINTAEQTKQALLMQLDEPERLCSGCAAMVDPSIGSVWCGVLELGDTRAAICDSFVARELEHEKSPDLLEQDGIEASALWDLIQGELAESLGPTHLNWLANTAAESHEGRVLTIAVPDEYTRAWLLARLSPAISQALEAVGYPEVDVQFITKEDRPPASRTASTGRKKPRLATLPLQPVPLSPGTKEPEPHRGGRFSPKFTFDQFVVGTGNRLAHAGALAVAEGSSSYNPLFIYGGVGVGKTHLLQAVGSGCAERGREALYIASETFTNDLISSIRSSSTADFRRRYREIDVLLVDDIHFIIGKESTQEEFFHTFNWLYDNGKQIVLSSDRAPSEMRVLDERLRSRFWWGLTADIQPPDHETRVEILRRKAEGRGKRLSSEVVEYLASQATGNVRELEGLLNRLLALSDLQQIDPLVALKSGLLNGNKRNREVDHNDILQAVSAYFHVDAGAICGKQRSRNIALPRHIAMYLMRQEARLSLPHIGDVLGGRDHSTVIYGCHRISQEMNDRAGRVRRDVEAIKSILLGS